MDKATEQEARNDLFEQLKKFRQNYPETAATHKFQQDVHVALTNYKILNDLYLPDDVLIARVHDYERFALNPKASQEDPGDLMEELAALSFRCIRGWERIDSYQSYAPQLDLLIHGSGQDWHMIFDYHLNLRSGSRSILVEAKNIEDRVDDKQFARFCGLLQNQFQSSCQLGVLFTRKGATGFTQSRVLRDARATQILFHARTSKFVVVFEHSDLLRLVEPGSLLKMLGQKILDVEAVYPRFDQDGDSNTKQLGNLPTHLSRHFTR